MTTSEETAKRLRQWGAIRHGSFQLSSGRLSDTYVDIKNATSTASRLNYIARSMIEQLVAGKVEADVIHGIGIGGIPLAAAICTHRYLGTMPPQDFEFSYSRPEPKEHGIGGWGCGAAVKDKRVVIVDDVLTTGESILEERERIYRAGGRPVAAVVVVDRADELGCGDICAAELTGEYNLPTFALCELWHLIKTDEAA